MEVERYSRPPSSRTSARLRPDLDALDALRASSAGRFAPKVRAMQLIAELEGEQRGLYGGAAGYIGYDGNLDTAITIRSAVLKDGVAHIHTGAGIVAGSVPEREFEETEHKAAAMRRAIEQAAATLAAEPVTGASYPPAAAASSSPEEAPA
jgi:anthranilate synthase component 1